MIDKDSHLPKETFRTEACQVIVEADLHCEDMVGVADELTRNGPVELVVNNVGITTTGWRSARQSSTWCSGRTRGGRGCSPTGW